VKSKRMRLFAASLLALVLLAAACGGDEDDGGGSAGGSDDGNFGEVKVVWASSLQAYVPQAQGPWRYGEEFGLNEEDEGDIQGFDSHATAAQILLADRADVIGTGFSNIVQLVEKGQDLRVFCPVQAKTSEHLMGVGVSSLEQITDPDVRVGIDSPGGLINYLMNSVFAAKGLTDESGDVLTVDDLENVKILEDGGLRLAALASGDINVGSLDVFEQAQLAKQATDEVTVLSITAADIDHALGNIFAAKKSWIDENPERAAAFCATVLKANRELASDFELYKEWALHSIEPPPDDETLQTNWDFTREYQVWPYNADELSEENFAADIEVLVNSGLLEESAFDFAFEDVVDVGPANAAVELLGGPVDPSEIEG
jgi:ABC-type nitrate/sulfonate/bicarbonate transport system substrate-binding protein